MSNVGKITVTVARFVANPSPDPCDPYCELSSPGAVAITDNAPNANGDPQVGYDPVYLNQIQICKKNTAGHVDVEFSFEAPNGTVYPATGVFALSQSLGNQDPTGMINFSKINGSVGALRLRDKWKHKGHAGTWPQTCPQWEVYIQIRNAAGDTGWIDPGVENSDDF